MPLPLYGSGGGPLRVRVADLELEVGAPQGGAIADALDLEPLLVAVGDARDHVRDQRARETVEGAVLAAVGRACDRELGVVLLDAHSGRHALRQLALRSVDANEL